MKITIDLSKWEDPSALICGADVLKSVIKSLKILQKEGVWNPRNDETDPLDWLEDILYLVNQVNKEIRRNNK